MRQQGAAKPGAWLALSYSLSETEKGHCFRSDCSSFFAPSTRAAPTRQGALGLPGLVAQDPQGKLTESTTDAREARGKRAEMQGPPCPGKAAEPRLLCCVLSPGTQTPPARFSAFLTLSGNSCSNFPTHLLPEMRTRISDSVENSKIFTSSNRIYPDRRLLEPASFMENASLRKS